MTRSIDGGPCLPPRYEVRRRIGGGSFGEVFEVYDTVRDRVLALKKIEGSATHLAGEFLALARLEDHPALAAPVDYSADGDHAWFTMEFARGVTLRQFMSAPDSLEHLTEVLRQAAGGLGFIHGHGFVHRDIKPENLVVDRTEDGSISTTILDLGLARPIDPGSAESTSSGTLHYIAPEVFLGHPPDPRSDLYSLGVLLYEWAAGRLPFDAPTPREIVRRVLYGSPPDPVEAPAAAPWLPDIIRRCLSRRIEDRPSSAGEILAALPARVGAPSSGAVFPGLYVEPAFVGRDRELAAIDRAFDRAAAGRATVLQLCGEWGSGRSRLLRELRIRRFPETLAWLELPATEAGSTRSRLNEACRRIESLAGVVPVGADDPAPPPVTDSSRMQNRVAFLESRAARLVEAAGRLRDPGVIVAVFDDPEGVDSELRMGLEFLTQEATAAPFLFIEVSTGGASSPNGPAAGGEPLQVGSLADDDVELIVRSLAGPEVEALDVRRLVGLSGGHPLSAVNLTRDLMSKGHSGIPETLSEVYELRIKEMSRQDPTPFRTLQAGAVLDPHVDPAIVAEMSGQDEAGSLKHLSALSRPGSPLVRVGADSPRYRFSQPLFAAAIRASLDSETLRSWHAGAARRLAGMNPSGREETDTIARHYLEAGPVHVAEAVAWARRAGAAAGDAYDWEPSFQWYERALKAAGPAGSERSELLGLAARAAGLAGRNREASERFRTLASESSEVSAATRAIRRHAEILQATLGDNEAGRTAIDEALERLRPGDDDAERARLLETAADGARIRGDVDAAVRLGEEALALMESIGAGDADRSRCLATLGFARLFTGRFDESRRDLDEAHAMAEKTGDLYLKARALQHLAIVEGHLGDYAAVRRNQETVYEISEKIGDVRRATAIDQSLGVADFYEGRLPEALERLSRGRRRALAIGDRQILCYLDLTLGQVHRSAGRFDAAEAALRAALDQADRSGIALARALSESVLGWVALTRGRPDQALEFLTASPLDAGRDPLATSHRSRLLGLYHLEAGDAETALALAERALEELGRVDSPKFEPAALELKARALLALDRLDPQLDEWIARGLDVSQQLNVPEYRCDLLCTRSELEERRGDAAAAVETAEAAAVLAGRHGLEPARVRAQLRQAAAWAAHDGLYDDRAEDLLDETSERAEAIGMAGAVAEASALRTRLTEAWDD